MTTLHVDIVPFQEYHKADIDILMTMITKEFAEPIAAPKSKAPGEITELPDKYWVAVTNGKVIGTIALSVLKNNSIVLKRMFLNKDFRGRGIASSLLNTVIKWATDNRAITIYLGTMTQFKAAQYFYEKHGFKKISQASLPPDCRVNPVDNLFYKKDLN
jgi:N-acetylglutamate synthase-like GNAT family acetyltransferase